MTNLTTEHLAASTEPHGLAPGIVHAATLSGWQVEVGDVTLTMLDYGIRGMADVTVTVVDARTVAVAV